MLPKVNALWCIIQMFGTLRFLSNVMPKLSYAGFNHPSLDLNNQHKQTKDMTLILFKDLEQKRVTKHQYLFKYPF